MRITEPLQQNASNKQSIQSQRDAPWSDDQDIGNTTYDQEKSTTIA